MPTSSPATWCRAPRSTTRRWRSTASPPGCSTSQLLVYAERASDVDARALDEVKTAIPVEPVLVTARPGGQPGLRALHDLRGRFAERYDALPGSAWLLRPDQHVAARWRRLQPAAVRAALARATGND